MAKVSFDVLEDLYLDQNSCKITIYVDCAKTHPISFLPYHSTVNDISTCNRMKSSTMQAHELLERRLKLSFA